PLALHDALPISRRIQRRLSKPLTDRAPGTRASAATATIPTATAIPAAARENVQRPSVHLRLAPSLCEVLCEVLGEGNQTAQPSAASARARLERPAWNAG